MYQNEGWKRHTYTDIDEKDPIERNNSEQSVP